MEENKTTEKVLSLDLSELDKKRKVIINGDENKFIELDTTDFSIIQRLQEAIPKIEKMETEYTKISNLDENNPEVINQLAESIKNLDSAMRTIINEIFDYNISDVILPKGTMFDLIRGTGKFKYEFIIEKVSSLYETDISKEIEKMQKKIKKHTQKYVR